MVQTLGQVDLGSTFLSGVYSQVFVALPQNFARVSITKIHPVTEQVCACV